MLVLNLLKSIPFFSSLSENDHLTIIENIRLNYFPEGHTIFQEGDEGDAMYTIRSGKVRIYKAEEKSEKTLNVLEANDFFGEMALISNKPRNATAQALEDCEVFVIYAKDLYELIKEKPEIANKISNTFVKRSKDNEFNS